MAEDTETTGTAASQNARSCSRLASSEPNHEDDKPTAVATNAESSFVASLCDDTLLRILSYADLPSLVCFARGTSRSLRHRFHSGREDTACPDIWHGAFANHNFAPVDDAAGGRSSNLLLQDGELGQTIDYFNALRHRLSLWSNLNGSSMRRKKALSTGTGRSKAATKQCYSLPSRLFRFVPLVPPDMMHYPPASSGGNNHDIIFSYLEDGSEEDGDGEDAFEIDDIDHHEVQDGDHLGHRGTMEFDPPPVEFACDSFSLTSPGTGTEYVLLNPFSGSVEVYDSILDNAISSDEGLMEQAMMDASEGILRKRRGRRGNNGRRTNNNSFEDEDLPDENSEEIAGEAMHRRIHSNHKMYDTPPKQVLFSVHDYFDLDLDEFFGQHTPFADSGRRERGSVTVDWVGVDSHVALKRDLKSIAGNVIGAARILNMESDAGDEEELACTEVFAWSNFEPDAEDVGRSPTYDAKYVCRAAGSFYFLDICANHQKLYAVFQSGRCPFGGSDASGAPPRGDQGGHRQLMDMEEESMVNDDGEPIRMTRSIFCLPLIRYGDAPLSPETIASYFPTPDACMVAQYPVSSFSVDPTGQILLVGTSCGTVEVWHTGMGRHNGPDSPRRLQILSVRESFMKRHRSMTMDERHTSRCVVDLASSAGDIEIEGKPRNIEFDDATETQDDLALLENNALDEEELPHKHPTSKISQVYLPRHMPVHQCGFVTKQRSSESGTTLLLWQTSVISSESKAQDLVDERFHITAMINLPLSAQCHPEVYYDGRRLIVFGKDHIGQIFLVYHVLGTRYDQGDFDESEKPSSSAKKKASSRTNSNNGEESGGVVQIGGERRVKFVNRIRHAGLGGLEYYDSMLLSANERFLLVNTKSGNLIGSDGARNASEGLLVIDLQECGSY